MNLCDELPQFEKDEHLLEGAFRLTDLLTEAASKAKDFLPFRIGASLEDCFIAKLKREGFSYEKTCLHEDGSSTYTVSWPKEKAKK